MLRIFLLTMGIDSSTEDCRLHPQDWTDDLSMAWERRSRRSPVNKIYHLINASIHLPFCSMAVRPEPCLLTLRKRSRLRDQMPENTSRHFLLGAQDGCGTRSTSLLAHRNLFWQLLRHGNSHGSCKDSFGHVMRHNSLSKTRAPWRVGDSAVGRGTAGWTTSRSGRRWPYRNCSRRPNTGNNGRGSLLNLTPCPSMT